VGRTLGGWEPMRINQAITDALPPGMMLFSQRCRGGLLEAIRSADPWRLTLTHQAKRKRRARYPTWEEIITTRRELIPDNVKIVMALDEEMDEWTVVLEEEQT